MQHQRTLSYHLYTLFLFTCRDFKSVIFPALAFAIAAVSASATTINGSPTYTSSIIVARLPLAFLWVWTNLLALAVSNQRKANAVLEDTVNRSWRPIPAGRLSPSEAHLLLWIALASALAISLSMPASLELAAISIALFALSWLYSEADWGSASIVARSTLTGIGALWYNWGALLALSGVGSSTQLTTQGSVWLVLTGVVMLTTIHATDIPDIEGDRASERRTIPLVFSETVARASVALSVLGWTLAGDALGSSGGQCEESISARLAWTIPATIAVCITAITLGRMGKAWDKGVWTLCCAWMTVMNSMPAWNSCIIRNFDTVEWTSLMYR